MQPWYQTDYGHYKPREQRYAASQPLYGKDSVTEQAQNEYLQLPPLCADLVYGIDLGKSYLDKNLDPVAGLVLRRTSLEKARLENLLYDLNARYEMLNQNTEALDYQICAVHSEIMQLPDIRIGMFKDLDKIRTNLEAKAIDLEQEKMREKSIAWKDIHAVKTELLESISQYSTSGVSAALISTKGSDQNY